MATPSLTRRRTIGIWTLIALASVICVLSIVTTWVKRQVLDDAAWSRATTQVVQDAAVQSALSTYLVNQLYDNVDVAAALGERLPPDLKPIAPPLAGALRDPATRGVQFLFTRPRIQQTIVSASAIAHEKLVNVLENETGFGISTGSGTVTLDLHELVVEVGQSLGLPDSALAKVPADAGTVTLMRSDQLSAAQTAVQAVKSLSVWLFVLVLAMYTFAVWLAVGHRRPVLRNVGWSLVLVGLVVLVVRRLLGDAIVSALASPGYTASTHRLWLIGTAILGQIAAAAILYGLVTALGAVLAGPTAAASSVRRRIAPVLNERPGVAWGIVAAAYLLAVLWGGTHALRTWWGILALAALLALGVEALRRQTLAEFPAGAAPAAGASPSVQEQLATLGRLHDAGALGDEEYENAKKLILT
jgi:hypothetical protein